MRNIIYPLIFCLLCPMVLPAQGFEHLKITDESIQRLDSVIRFSFNVEADRRLTRGGKTAVIIPRISDGGNTVSFTPVVAQGKPAKVAWDRHRWAAGDYTDYEGALNLPRTSSLSYTAEVPFQRWMVGADLYMDFLIAGCCSVNEESALLAGDVLQFPNAPTMTEPSMEVFEASPLPTVAEELAQVLDFVLPWDEFDEMNPLKIYDDERHGSITIYFHINEYDIVTDYADNRQTLANLLAAIEIIGQSGDSRLKGVLVGGFASPDGPYEKNDRLAWERAVSVKEYIMGNSGIGEDLIMIYNGSADWQGLRLEVTKDRTMPSREEVLQIIDNTPIWDARSQTGRLSKLMRLQGGDVYRYMSEHIFPKLRNGGLIRVYYENNIN